MGKKQTADGRWIIGGGENSTDYKGFLHWRECYICLTESGATEESVDYLNALKDYALAHYALGEPIMPPSMTVWVVANGKTTAVQADDVKVEDGDYTICGITYSDGAWDYSNAGQGQGGGGLPDYSEASEGDVLSIDSNGDPAWETPSGGGGQFLITVTPNDEETELSVDKTYEEIASAYAAGKTFYFYYPQFSTPFAAYYVGAEDGGFDIHGVYVSVEAVAEDTADIMVRTIHVIASSTSGIMAYTDFSSVTGTFETIPPMN